MKRTILISLAAGVAIVPALLGVAAASTGAPSSPDHSRSATPTGPSTIDDRGGHAADDSATAAGSPTSSASSADDRDGRGSDDATASSASSADDRQGSDDVTASSASSAEDRQGRDSDDATTSSPRTTVTSSSSRATSSATVDDHGHGTEAGDDSGGHGGKN